MLQWKDALTCRPITLPLALSIIYLIPRLCSMKWKTEKASVLLFQDGQLWGPSPSYCVRVCVCVWERKRESCCAIVCICNCVHVFVWRRSYTLCAFVHICIYFVFSKKKKILIVYFLFTSCPNTLNTTTDGCVSSERWFKSHISMERVTTERAEGPNGCLFCHKSSPGCAEGRSILQ